MQEKDTFFMAHAIEEAKRGWGRTAPNPAVGAVIVSNGAIVSRGYHRRAGSPHAEVNALQAMTEKVTGATMYVTLEPCNHTGKTPPCTEAIVHSGAIGRVVIGMQDPNPNVAGNGIDRLREAGIEVSCGVLERECRALNYPFLKHVVSGLPWVVMKAGLSLDGRISYKAGSGGKVTGDDAQVRVHCLRDRYDAILVGIDTVVVDDPSLTTRRAGADGRDPLRVILDSTLRISDRATVVHQQSAAETWVYCCHGVADNKRRVLAQQGVRVIPVGEEGNERVEIEAVLNHLGRSGITSVLVEGGATIHGAMLQTNMVDEVFLFYAPFFIGDAGTPLLTGFSVDERVEDFFAEWSIDRVGGDFLFHGIRRLP